MIILSMVAGKPEVVVGGIYKHYKGNKYLVLGLGRHSETLEWMVVYVTLYENEEGPLWCRPANMWNEEVEYKGKKMKRFTLCE